MAGSATAVVDLGGAGVIHLTAGTLALVLALELGPRYGRFGRRPAPIPGHNLPLAILGSLVVLLGLTALNAIAYPGPIDSDSPAGLAAANTLLAAAGGLATSFGLILYRSKRVDPTALCRGSARRRGWPYPPARRWWKRGAAVLTGAIAGAIVQATMRLLDRRQIDDPVGAVAVHGAGGAWGLRGAGPLRQRRDGVARSTAPLRQRRDGWRDQRRQWTRARLAHPRTTGGSCSRRSSARWSASASSSCSATPA